MAKTSSFDKKVLFSSEDILKVLKDYYDIKNMEHNNAMLRMIQRFMKDNKKPYEKGKGNTHCFTQSAVKDLLEDVKIIRSCRRIANKSGTYQTNSMVLQEQAEELAGNRNELYQSWESVGISPEEGNILEFDKLMGQKYLRVDELDVLNKKGLHLRSDLSDSEKEMLCMYEQHFQENTFREKKIDELFHQKKLELMITSIFENQGFTLDEDLLRSDITNYIYGGEFTVVATAKTDLGLDKDATKPSPVVRRSFLRLKQGKGYIRKKK